MRINWDQQREGLGAGNAGGTDEGFEEDVGDNEVVELNVKVGEGVADRRGLDGELSIAEAKRRVEKPKASQERFHHVRRRRR